MNMMQQQFDHYIERALLFAHPVFLYQMGNVGIVLT